MKNLTTFYSDILENNEHLYLYFKLGDNKYAINVKQVMEIMKLPLLEYPQKLANNVIGLLNYNNFTINVLDLRFYLDIKIKPYSVSNQLLVVKTDESLFGLVIDKVEDIISLDQSKIEYFQSQSEDKIIEFIYKKDNESISVIDLVALETVLRKGILSSDIDIPSLFPQDDDARYEFTQRNLMLMDKANTNLITNVFSQDKFISFSLNDSLYCINLEYIKEFLKNISITKIPCSLDYIAGVIALKGDFITIINTKRFLNISDNSTKPDFFENKNNIIIIEMSNYKIGLLVDEIFNIVNIPEELIKENSYNQEKYILSEVILEDKLYSILDIKSILSDERFFIEEV